MLLRSASTPLLNSFLPSSLSKDASLEPEIVHQIARIRSISLSASFSSSSLSCQDDSMEKMARTLSETDLNRKPTKKMTNGMALDERGEGGQLNTASLECGMSWGASEGCEQGLGLLVGGGVGGGGGKICGGGGGMGGGDDDGSAGSWDSGHGNDSTDGYYQKMIEANPGNAMLLSNYAKFLKECRGDLVKAEGYCGRAILADPNDGNVLSMYADLIWQSDKDASRAETYFSCAIEAAPDDCYVLGSYARFLWDAEEDDEGGEQETSKSSQPSFFHDPAPPLAPAS